jgi:hypothetical protein
MDALNKAISYRRNPDGTITKYQQDGCPNCGSDQCQFAPDDSAYCPTCRWSGIWKRAQPDLVKAHVSTHRGPARTGTARRTAPATGLVDEYRRRAEDTTLDPVLRKGYRQLADREAQRGH